MSIQEVVTTILTLTGYPEKDRESFCNELLSMAGQGALLLYVKDFPEEKQKELEAQIEGKTYEEVAPLLEAYTKEESFQKHFSEEVDSVLGDYLQEVDSALSADQKKQVGGFLETLSTAQQSS